MHITRLLARAAQRHPDRPAWGTASYLQADRRVNRLANALLGLGLEPGRDGEPGDRVGMALRNCPEAIEVMLGVMRAGLVAVPLNVRYLAKEIGGLLNDAECSALIYGSELSEPFAPLREQVPSVRHWIQVGKPASADPTYEALLEKGSDEPPSVQPGQDDVAQLFYTSGTTGSPKGAMITHRSLLTLVAINLLDIGTPGPTDVILHALPISFAGGYFMHHYIARGAKSVFLPPGRFDADMFGDVVRKEHVTAVALVPTMINTVLSGSRAREDLKSLDMVFYGGGAMSTERLRQGKEMLGSVFCQSYGLGEMPLSITVLGRDDHTESHMLSAGRATTLTAVRIQDDDWRPLDAGQTGEIAARGDLLMKGYWKRPDATADAIHDGWFRTGDIGRIDEDGYLYVSDRKKNMIKSGGATVSPSEVENAIYHHPAVHEVAVIGVPDDTWGEAVKALVVLKPGATATEAQIIETCEQHVAPFKKPRTVEFVPDLPKSGNNKILHRELRDRYWAGRARKV